MAAPVVAATSAVPTTAVYAFMGATAYCLLLFALMVLLGWWTKVQELMKSNWIFMPLILTYLLLLVQSWQPDTLSLMMPGNLQTGLSGLEPQFFPSIESISTLFSRSTTVGSFLVHLLLLNVFVARSCFLDGIRAGVPTVHSLLLATVVGPLGLISHMLTKALFFSLAKVFGRPTEKPVTLDSKQGTITILPYN